MHLASLANSQDFLVNLPKTLSLLPAGGLSDGGALLVEDYDQDTEVEIVIQACDDFGEEEKQWKLGGNPPKKKEGVIEGGKKRGRDDDTEEVGVEKKRKGEEGEAIVL